ncbi:hypothetical protein LCGC14_0224130 [marine sediment metagenome]|uniref:Uncharacterized protein n=1 Tax=marine sediment metagenome TaxID=412755 RepID=A0A0F9UCD2_9ZZZZ
MSLIFTGCPIHEGEINVEDVCLFCRYYTGNKEDVFYPLKWCRHPDNIKKRDSYFKKRRELM